MEYYLEELQAVISHHQLTEYYLYGSSWGTMVAQEWAVTRPRGLYGLLLDGALCDPHLYIQTQWRDRLGTLPDFSQRMLKDIIARKDFSHPALPLLDDALGKMFSLRTVPRPDVWQKCFDQMDKTIYVEMQGVCEFTIGGLLETWSVIERLHLVQVPTIVLAGEFDTMTVECSKAVVDNIPTAWPLVVIPRASHCKLLEEPAACIREMSKFLNTVEACRRLQPL
jgi:L-proline amide hydrolase